MRRLDLIVLTVLPVLLLAPASRADESRRRQLRDEIDRLLSDMASELRDVPGDSSTSDLDRTVDYAGRVSEKARDLKNEAEGDSDARRIGESYPDIASRYRDAAGYLRELKNGHRKLDEWPRKCEDATRELVSRMRGYTESPDPRGVDEVPKLARELGRVGKEALEQAERTKNEMYTWLDRADDFSYSDGRWSDVRGNLVSAGQTMYAYTVKQWEQIKRDDVCANLAREERNPLVEEAMKKLFEGKKGIEMVYESLDRQLGEMASYLDRLEGDSSDSDIGSAEGKLGEVERLVEQLDRIKGNDGEARRRVELYRNLVRATREALPLLRTLKQSQFAADKAPAKCGEATEQLRGVIRGFLDKRDVKGVTQIPLRARGLAEPIKGGLGKTDEQHAVMERALSDAQRFDPSEGRWRDVRDRYRASATAVFEYWKRAREAAHTACDELAKGDQHAEVKAAVENLSRSRSDNQNELDRLRVDHEKWKDGIKELREWYKQDTNDVREMFCKIPESPGDSAEGDAYAARLTAIADRMRDRIRPKWGTIQADGDKLVARADKLMREEDDDVRAGSQRIAAEVTRKLASLQNLLDNELKGANDPEFRGQLELGKDEHKRIQADSSKCEVAEVTIPGAGARLDCVRVSSGTCYLVEIKPNNGDAQDRGRSRLGDYRKAVEEYFKKNRRDLDRAFTDKLQIFKRCIADDSISLDTELRVYDFCPPAGKLYNDFVVD